MNVEVGEVERIYCGSESRGQGIRESEILSKEEVKLAGQGAGSGRKGSETGSE